MKMELIQPFINSADAVLAETLQQPARMSHVSMDEEVYRRKGVAAVVQIEGDIEGRVIFDAEEPTAVSIASALANAPASASEELVRDTMLELANLVIGNAVTSLNDQGFRFRVRPPELHAGHEGTPASEDTEAVVMHFETAKGSLFMNIAMRYKRPRKQERKLAVGR